VNFPVLLKYNFTKEFYTVIGPQIGFLSDENSSYQNLYFFDPFTGEILNDRINKTDFGLTLGVGCNVDHFVVDLRFYNGLAPITNYYRFKNTVIQASIGYKFL
jgi:hypothetical protein